MDMTDWQNRMDALAVQLDSVREQMQQLSAQASTFVVDVAQTAPSMHGSSFFVDALMVLILACFVGYYVIWNVTPALHAPLMGITNAISSVIIVGALIAAGPMTGSFSKWLGFAGIVLASINIFGGFVVTNRMLEMFTSRKKK